MGELKLKPNQLQKTRRPAHEEQARPRRTNGLRIQATGQNYKDGVEALSPRNNPLRPKNQSWREDDFECQMEARGRSCYYREIPDGKRLHDKPSKDNTVTPQKTEPNPESKKAGLGENLAKGLEKALGSMGKDICETDPKLDNHPQCKLQRGER